MTKKKCPRCFKEVCECIIKKSSLLESNTIFNTFKKEILNEGSPKDKKDGTTKGVTILNG